jgi:MoxR-like ATPase
MLAAQIGSTHSSGCTFRDCFENISLITIQNHVASIACETPLREYLVDLAQATRTHKAVSLGLSPRGLIIWQRMAQAWAFLSGRDFVTPDDVQHVMRPILELRLSGSFDSIEKTIAEIVQSVPVPA